MTGSGLTDLPVLADFDQVRVVGDQQQGPDSLALRRGPEPDMPVLRPENLLSAPFAPASDPGFAEIQPMRPDLGAQRESQQQQQAATAPPSSQHVHCTSSVRTCGG